MKTKKSSRRAHRPGGAKRGSSSTRGQELKEKRLLVRIKIENANDEQDRELRLLIDQAIQERFNEIEIEYDD